MMFLASCSPTTTAPGAIPSREVQPVLRRCQAGMWADRQSNERRCRKWMRHWVGPEPNGANWIANGGASNYLTNGGVNGSCPPVRNLRLRARPLATDRRGTAGRLQLQRRAPPHSDAHHAAALLHGGLERTAGLTVSPACAMTTLNAT